MAHFDHSILSFTAIHVQRTMIYKQKTNALTLILNILSILKKILQYRHFTLGPNVILVLLGPLH